MGAEQTSPRPAGQRRHHPGLDGVRGAGVAAVLCFHGGFSWAQGGYLGVSTFFTLSGFLITGLLLGEREERGAIRLARFWERRFRRLLPALLVAVVLIAGFAVWVADGDQLARIRADGLATIGYVANWRFVFSGQDYTALFDAPSPFLHAWSLAIEEQFYVFFPLLVAGVLAVAKGRRGPLTLVLASLTAMSVAAGVVLGDDHTRVYYGTDTRAAELLLGGLLAVWAARVPDLADRRRPLVATLGGVGLVASVLAWVVVSQTEDVLYRGGFALYAVASASVVAGAVAPGPIRAIMSFRPLRLLGLVSYGAYLYHWPVFLWLTPARTGLGGSVAGDAALFGLRLAATLAIAVVSYRVVERPIRAGWLPRRWAVALTPVTMAVAAAVLVVATVTPGSPGRLEPESTVLITDVAPARFAPARAVTPADPLRVLLVGDSVGFDAEPGITAVLRASGAATVVADNRLGLGLTNDQFDWRADWSDLVDQHRPELVVLLLGGWDEGFIAEQGIDAYTAVAEEGATILTDGGARLLVLGYPITADRLTGKLFSRRSVEAFRALSSRMVGTVDYRSLDPVLSPDGRYVSHLPGPDGRERVRKLDRTHFCPAGAARIGRLVLDSVASVWSLPEPDPSWRAGDWFGDPRYDDPPGACPK